MSRWVSSVLSLLLGLGLFWVGFVNLFWGNDPFFGLAIVVASGLYCIPIAIQIRALFEPKYWRCVLAILALLILWAALGVGDLEDKVELMNQSFPMPNITGI